jgi:two-component system, OmpR family, phosphate regulon response regulator PhoB
MATAKQPTILIIDDERQHLTMQSLILKEAGFRPITVVVGSQSLSLPDHDPPDLILLDYRLNSVLNSQQVAQLLREKFRRIPIVLVSSMQEMPVEMKPFVDSFLRKGNPEDLVALVKNMLGRSPQAE